MATVREMYLKGGRGRFLPDRGRRYAFVGGESGEARFVHGVTSPGPVSCRTCEQDPPKSGAQARARESFFPWPNLQERVAAHADDISISLEFSFRHLLQKEKYCYWRSNFPWGAVCSLRVPFPSQNLEEKKEVQSDSNGL